MYELQSMVERYPFDQSARIKLLNRLYSSRSDNFGTELRKAALFVPDRKVLFYLVEGGKYSIAPQIKESNTEETAPAKNSDRTSDLINNFLLEMPDDQPKRRLTLVDATSDYAAYLAQQDEMGEAETVEAEEPATVKEQGKTVEVAKKSQDEIRREPLELPEQEEDIENSPEEPENTISGGYFTETLAKIYIKQGKYDGAIEIMRKLSADNPKKSCYFADQIRFLEKVVINSKNKK